MGGDRSMFLTDAESLSLQQNAFSIDAWLALHDQICAEWTRPGNRVARLRESSRLNQPVNSKTNRAQLGA